MQIGSSFIKRKMCPYSVANQSTNKQKNFAGARALTLFRLRSDIGMWHIWFVSILQHYFKKCQSKWTFFEQMFLVFIKKNIVIHKESTVGVAGARIETFWKPVPLSETNQIARIWPVSIGSVFGSGKNGSDPTEFGSGSAILVWLRNHSSIW